jgi:hypothetical protein
MNRSLVTVLTGVVVASSLASVPARAGIEIQIFPPSWFIATSRPVYYEGHAAYWYGNRWHYRDRDRDGWRWRTYDEEPRYLREYRAHREPDRHYYEREYERHHEGRGRDRERERDRDRDRERW